MRGHNNDGNEDHENDQEHATSDELLPAVGNVRVSIASGPPDEVLERKSAGGFQRNRTAARVVDLEQRRFPSSSGRSGRRRLLILEGTLARAASLHPNGKNISLQCFRYHWQDNENTAIS